MSPSKHATLPHDVWLHVAQFLPAPTLRELLSVNSSLFNIAMDLRYRQMSFAYLDKRMVRSLVRLKDPLVAKRVRVLHVYPGFLEEAIVKEKASPPLQRSLRFCLMDFANHLREQKLFPKNLKFRLVRTLRRTEDVIQVMLGVLGSLPNVTDYYVRWCGLPTIGASAVPLLSTVFQANLRKLSLDISLENVKNLLSPICHMHNLEELHICVHPDHLQHPSQRDEILRSHLAPAISRQRASLHTLVIQAWEAMNLSPLFSSIQYMPALETLSIGIPVDTQHLGHAEGFSSFLNRQAPSLRCLRLRATQYGGAGLDPDLISFDNWIRDALRGVRLPKLRNLDISSGLFPIETSIFCLRLFTRTLTSLSLTGSYRTYDDVEDILNVLTSQQSAEGGLGKLRLGPVSLSPQLIDLLAEKLPRLYRLELVARDLLPHALDFPLYYRVPATGTQESKIVKFLSEMRKRSYPCWQLGRMSLLVDALPNRQHYESLLEQHFLRCVPSIRTFT